MIVCMYVSGNRIDVPNLNTQMQIHDLRIVFTISNYAILFVKPNNMHYSLCLIMYYNSVF